MKPLLKWPGGKSREIARFYGMIPPFARYIEPFFGGGALYFHLMPERAAINDVSRDLMDFYRMVQQPTESLKRCCAPMPPGLTAWLPLPGSTAPPFCACSRASPRILILPERDRGAAY